MNTTSTTALAPTSTALSNGSLRWLARAGMTGPILFTATFVAQQWLRRDTYDWVAEPVSNLEAGPQGWVQQANFVVFGLLMAAFAVGMAREVSGRRLGRSGPALLGLSSAGLFLAAVFPLEQDAQGVAYDPGLHFVAGVTFFLSSGLALLALSRSLAGDARWGRLPAYALVAGLLAFAGFVVMGRLAIPDGAALHPYAGLAQRVVIVGVTFPCLVLLAARLHRLADAGG
ncbi:DUF998 domain-containing protein [Phycicoccus sp. Soil803]|uniref:DUF998 domain-containing protein n=1 Tax=Phycicoccus sp. Soil803 TaxID=1736415 RepID=UPI0009E8CB24|nr:DUF998 domain-containing protein [Phycicoccus sp. Soil803]